jgi:hypothetical protein
MLTFESCANLLSKRESKKLANNTYLSKDGDDFVVTLHSTKIIRISPENEIVLNSGGYRTKTTKQRLNEFSKASVNQKSGIWYINDIAFYDGVKIDANGSLINPKNLTKELEDKKTKLDKMVKKYIAGYIQWALENGVERSSVDCWYCLMGLCDSIDHVWCHLEENYYFGSFIDVAISGTTYTPYRRPLIEQELKANKTDMLKGILTSYFKKIKPSLMEYMN